MVVFNRQQPEPVALTQFKDRNPEATAHDFDSIAFRSVKQATKVALNTDQGGLCAYCEKRLSATAGQLDHVLPKSRYPDWTFDYSNLVHSCCDQPAHCGQRKADKILPILPGPANCNDGFILSTNGWLDARAALSKQQRHEVHQTRDMLGMNHPQLRLARERWILAVLELITVHSDACPDFLSDKPFRHIIQKLQA